MTTYPVPGGARALHNDPEVPFPASDAGHGGDAHHGNGHHHGPAHLAHHFDTPEQQFSTGKLGMWVFLGTEILMFGGLFCAYAVYRSNHPDVFQYAHHYLSTSLGAINTVVLIASSFTMAWGVRCAQVNDNKGLIICLIMTLIGGFGFMGIKAVEYYQKISHDMFVGADNLYDRRYEGPHKPGVYGGDGHAEGEAGDSHGEDPGAAPSIDTGREAGVAATDVAAPAVSQSRPDAGDPAPADLHAGGPSGEASRVPEVAAAPVVPDPGGRADPGGPVADLPGAGTSSGGISRAGEIAASSTPDTLSGNNAVLEVIDPAYFDPNAGSGDAARYTPSFVNAGGLSDVYAGRAPAAAEAMTYGDVQAKDRTHVAAFFSIYYAMTGLHGIHVVIGMGLITWVLIKAIGGAFSDEYFTPVDLVGLYWHLVDLIWIFLFPLLYLIH